MGSIHALKAVGIGLHMDTKHTGKTTSAFVAHVVDGRVRELVFSNVLPDITMRPKSEWPGSRMGQIVGIASFHQIVLLPLFALLRPDPEKDISVQFCGLFSRLFLEPMAAAIRGSERGIT